MKFIKPIKQLLWGARIYGCQEILGQILSRKELMALTSACPDESALLKECASMFRLSETQLAMEVARRNKVAFIAEPPAIDLSLLPVGLSTYELRAKGAIPLMVESRMAGLACSNPSSYESLKPKLGELPLVISLLDSISLALDHSQDLLKESQKRAQEQKTQRKKQLLKKVLDTVIEEGLAYRTGEIKIAVKETQIIYSFELEGGQAASGFIDRSLRDELFTHLQELAQEKRQTLLVAENEHSYQVSCQPTKEIALITLEQAELARPKRGLRPFAALASELTSPSQTQLPALKPKNSISRNQKPLVFIVDDNLTFLKVLERFFSRQEVNTLHAQDGQSALKMLHSGECLPDVIVSDVHMPQMNGFEFISKLKQDDRFKHIPLVMLTSDCDLDTELRLIEEGIDVFITKNEDPRLLCAQVKRLIGKRNCFAA